MSKISRRELGIGAAVMVAAPLATPAMAQQAPPTDANGLIVILENMEAEPPGVEVWINDGPHVELLRAPGPIDITAMVRPSGMNRIRVRWSAPIQALRFKIAFARASNRFQTVLIVQSTAAGDPALSRADQEANDFWIPDPLQWP